LVVCCVVALVGATAEAAPERLWLRDATVIDGTGAPPRPHCDVLISDGNIVAVGPKLDGGDAKVVPLMGRWLVPGFMDLHVHLFLHPWDEKGAIQPRWDREATLAMLRQLLAHGVTTVRDPGAETEAAVTLRDAVAAKKLLGPRIFTAGRMLNTSDFAPEPFARVRSPADVEREISWQAALGVDAIKVYSGMPPQLVRVAVASARAHGLPVLAHLQATTWTEAAELGVDTVEHAAPWSSSYLPPARRDAYSPTLWGRVYWLEEVDLDGPPIRAMIDALATHDVTVDPTLVAMWTKLFGDQAAKSPELAVAPPIFADGWPAGSFTADWTPAQYQRGHAVWPKLLGLIRRLHARGVRLTVGTDTPTPWIVPGVSVHEEMTLLAAAGLAPLLVIRAATGDAARALHRESALGSIAPGRRADLVVLTRDPLVDIRNTRAIETVYLGGVALRPSQMR
jgi:imidazolonepropionase-like amidohydrolase